MPDPIVPAVTATVVRPANPTTEKNAKNFKPQPTRQERDMKREKRTEQLEQENERLKKELEGFRKQEQEKKADRRQANLPQSQMLTELTYLKQRIKTLEANKAAALTKANNLQIAIADFLNDTNEDRTETQEALAKAIAP